MLKNLVCAAAFACALMPAAQAADLGDPAAPLAIQEWVKGEPVDLAAGKGKNIYVVEFWATWCGPCRVSIPHLSELQAKYKDKNVVFVGISDETADEVKPFVEEQGEEMAYTVAVDKDGQTNQGYMAAYGQGGIPTAFIVDKEGNVAWVGHPMGELESTLDALIAGTYDLDAMKAAAEEMKAESEAIDSISGELDQLAEQLMTGKITEANAAAKATLDSQAAMETAKQNEHLLAFTGWLLVAMPVAEGNEVKPDYKLAQQLLEAALKASNKERAPFYAFYSRALMKNGDAAGALKQVDKALELETDESLKTQLNEWRDEYKAAAESTATPASI